MPSTEPNEVVLMGIVLLALTFLDVENGILNRLFLFELTWEVPAKVDRIPTQIGKTSEFS
ncbi:MAG: hypothetical protein VXZ82_14850 [Planctomycetota bacterium]|nr:hypothetical protein [Planctomycetota bacterium]